MQSLRSLLVGSTQSTSVIEQVGRLACTWVSSCSQAAHRHLASQAEAQQAANSEPSTSGREALSELKPDLVEQFLSTANMCRKDKLRHKRQEVMKEFQRHQADTASPEVLVALWTHKIREQVKEFYLHPKNPVVMREYEMLMHKRRRVLAHLRDTNFSAYAACVQKLGLADVFGRMTSADRYPVGKAHDDPAGASDAVQRLRFAFHRKFKQKKTSQWKRLLPQLQAQDPNLPPPPGTLIPGSVQRLEPQQTST